MPAILYGANHAYGSPASGTESTVQTISRDDLIKWHFDWFKPGSSTIIVTGDTTLAELTPMLESAAIDRVNYDLPDNYWANYGASMRGLTETQLTTAGKKFVRPDEIIWLVVGDVSKIESGILRTRLRRSHQT